MKAASPHAPPSRHVNQHTHTHTLPPVSSPPSLPLVHSFPPSSLLVLLPRCVLLWLIVMTAVTLMLRSLEELSLSLAGPPSVASRPR